MTVDLSFDEIIAEIGEFDLDLGDALARHRRLMTDVPEPGLLLERYAFGAQICGKGVPMRARPGEIFEEKFKHEYGLPFGLVLKGYLEITESTYSSDPYSRAAQALLGPGDFIGLFEFLDSHTGAGRSNIPDWTITAGSMTLRCAYRTNNQRFAKHICKKYPDLDISEHVISRADSLVDQLSMLPGLAKCFSENASIILYFGKDWFDCLNADHPNRELKSSGVQLKQLLAERAWRAASRVRPISSNIAPFFLPVDQNAPSVKHLHDYQRNLRFFIALYDLFTARRPMYMPENSNGDWGPYGDICRMAIDDYRGDTRSFVLRPMYLSPSTPGFMPINKLVPHFAGPNESHETVLHNILDAIFMAANREKAGDSQSVLRTYDQLIDSLSIRLPADRTKKDSGTSVVTYKAERANRRILFREVDERSFFEPYNIVIEKPGEDFFRSCIKMDVSQTRES